MGNAVVLRWLDGAPPPASTGVRWGVPWSRGAVSRADRFTLTDADGASIPVQSRALATWPDGSLKWTAHAAILPAEKSTEQLVLSPGGADAPLPPSPLQVREDEDAIEIENGVCTFRLPRHGRHFVESIRIDGRSVALDGRLVCLRDDRSRYATERLLGEETFTSEIDSAAVEQRGPILAVVKVRGRHRSEASGRSWLPFTLRLYFMAGTAAVRMVHSVVFDGDPGADFIRGLGVRFTVPLREQLHNRHVRLAGEATGLFAEPVRVIAGRRNPSPESYARQIAGERLPDLEELPYPENVAKMAAWDGFKLTQLSPDAFRIEKRTGAHSAWIHAWSGRRSLGLAFIGDASGGLALGQKDFWQLHPTGLEVQGAATEAATLTTWLWAPDAPTMDLRHYDIEEHGLEASYEDIEPGWSTAHGIARTTELLLCPFASVPRHEELLALARVNAAPPRLVCAPEHYHGAGVFGIWSLPDRSTPARAWIEDQIDDALSCYQGQVEERRWYGFWDYGDVMHSYDPARHQWRYDIGGFAWANTELMPDMWLWYSFLRTGRADVFRMAEAMTRHTQEVDVYHTGPLAGLGTRHNVRHWGCGAKEIRISQAALKRFYYYLTADERTADLLDEVTDADYRLVAVDPLRKIEPKSAYPTHMRVGPDWFAACGNWLAAWERTGDTRYRDKIRTGMRCLAAMPRKLFSGFSYGYDPSSGRLYRLHEDVHVPHLAALMGGPEVCMELTPLIDLPEWNDAWLHYCRYLQAPPEEQRQALGGTQSYGRGPHYARMTGYAARALNDAALAARAWQEFLGEGGARGRRFAIHRYAGPDVPTAVDEAPTVSTNDTAQWCLNAIELLELVGAYLPAG